MNRLLSVSLLLAALLAGAAPADAQIGRRLLDRARDAVRAPADAATAVTQAVTSAATGVVGGSSQTTLDYSRFLDMRYNPLRGEFTFGEPKDHLIFPPAGLDISTDGHGEYQIRTTGGRVVARQALGMLQTTGSDAFLTLGIMGSPRSDGPLATGAYTLDLVFHGQVASRIPFTVEAASNGDPFSPQTIHRRDGPWRTLAYFNHATDRRDQHLVFHSWLEATGGESRRLQFVLSRDGTPVAACKTSRCPSASTDGDWSASEVQLVTYASRDATNATPFTIADMTPGAYVMTVQTLEGDRVLQTYPFTGGAGAIMPHARSAVDYEPRHDFLTPRRMEGQMRSESHSLYWVEAAR